MQDQKLKSKNCPFFGLSLKCCIFLPDESESSDDDEPLIKMIKKPPTEEQLKQAIKDLLKDANLEEVTMKQITRQVCYFKAFIGTKWLFEGLQWLFRYFECVNVIALT